MSVSLEETIAKLDEVHKRGLLGVCGIKINYILKLLRELQERRKSDNEIPFGNASFSELDSIINAYEVHGNHKKVVELLKELRERRERSEIAKPTGETVQKVSNEDLISRKSAIDAVNNAFDRETLLTGFVRSIAVRAIRDMPSAQPERKKGKWKFEKMKHIINGEVRDVIICSECDGGWFRYDISDNTVQNIPNFCPNCGAKMEEKQYE